MKQTNKLFKIIFFFYYMVNKKTKINALNYANEMINDINNKLTEMNLDKLNIKVDVPENDKKQKTPRKKKVVQLVEKVEQVEDKPKKRGRPKKTIVVENI